MSNHEVVKLTGVLVNGMRAEAYREATRDRSDFGDVINTDPLEIHIRGRRLTVPGDLFYFADYLDPTQFQLGDRLALLCTNNEYVVLSRVVLGIQPPKALIFEANLNPTTSGTTQATMSVRLFPWLVGGANGGSAAHCDSILPFVPLAAARGFGSG